MSWCLVCFYRKVPCFWGCTCLFRLSTCSPRQGTITKTKLRLPIIVCISGPSLLLTGRSVLSSCSTSKRSDMWETQRQQRSLSLFIHSKDGCFKGLWSYVRHYIEIDISKTWWTYRYKSNKHNDTYVFTTRICEAKIPKTAGNKPIVKSSKAWGCLIVCSKGWIVLHVL